MAAWGNDMAFYASLSRRVNLPVIVACVLPMLTRCSGCYGRWSRQGVGLRR